MSTPIAAIARKLDGGHLNFFLGAAASVPNPTDDWRKVGGLPSAHQLRDWLLEISRKVAKDRNEDHGAVEEIFGARGGSLAEVASYVELRDYDQYTTCLRTAFARERPAQEPPAVIPALIAESIERAQQQARVERRGYSYPVIMTTNFDTLVEDALDNARLPYRTFILSGEEGCNKLVQGDRSYGIGNNRKELATAKAIDKMTHVLKLHGQVAANQADPTKLVMSESDYIRYLVNTPVDRIMPFSNLKTAWDNRSCLFLGYSFSDWNMRAVLRYLWPSGEKPGVSRWAVSMGFSPYQQVFLEKEFGVTTIVHDLGKFCLAIRDAWGNSDDAKRAAYAAEPTA